MDNQTVIPKISQGLPTTYTSAGSGTGRMINPTLTPRGDTSISPIAGALLGAAAGSLMSSGGGGSILSGGSSGGSGGGGLGSFLANLVSKFQPSKNLTKPPAYSGDPEANQVGQKGGEIVTDELGQTWEIMPNGDATLISTGTNYFPTQTFPTSDTPNPDYTENTGDFFGDYDFSNDSFAAKGGLITPLMKSGGLAHYAEAGAVNANDAPTDTSNGSSILNDISGILSSGAGKGAGIGALMAYLLNQAGNAGGVNLGVDMSQVGNIAPRSTVAGPAKFVPYSEYSQRAASPEPMPQDLSNMFGTPSMTPLKGGLIPNQRDISSLTPMPSTQPAQPVNAYSMPVAGASQPLASPMQQTATSPIAAPLMSREDRRAARFARQPRRRFNEGGDVSHYTYGEEINPSDILQSFSDGGEAESNLPHVPTVNGRHDYRAGSRVTGEGDGTSDDIPAMLADGEYVFSADVVSALGNGSTKAGADRLDKMVHDIRARDRSTHPSKLPPDAKSPLQYLNKSRSK